MRLSSLEEEQPKSLKEILSRLFWDKKWCKRLRLLLSTVEQPTRPFSFHGQPHAYQPGCLRKGSVASQLQQLDIISMQEGVAFHRKEHKAFPKILEEQ